MYPVAGLEPGFLINIVLLSVASGTLALTLTYSHITKPIRRALQGNMLGEFASCPYCVTHWTSLFAAYWLGGPLTSVVVNWLVITGLSSLFIGILLRLFLFREGENEELRETIRELMGEKDAS